MSKFIRTNEGIFEVVFKDLKGSVDENEKCILVKRENPFIEYYLMKKDIIKQADTIEELCDEFHIEFDSLWLPKEILYSKYYHFDIAKQNLEDNETLYGVIHIKGKGLIYVAKMNENGELVLI